MFHQNIAGSILTSGGLDCILELNRIYWVLVSSVSFSNVFEWNMHRSLLCWQGEVTSVSSNAEFQILLPNSSGITSHVTSEPPLASHPHLQGWKYTFIRSNSILLYTLEIDIYVQQYVHVWNHTYIFLKVNSFWSEEGLQSQCQEIDIRHRLFRTEEREKLMILPCFPLFWSHWNKSTPSPVNAISSSIFT